MLDSPPDGDGIILPQALHCLASKVGNLQDSNDDDIILPPGAGWLLRWEFTRGLLSSIGYRRYLIDGLGEEEERG